ncbi:MAG TPA: hypothetical protein VG102_03395 [Candidatus Paceibacterota bacterium]|jgi:hypothetical protein|nr:hypothetical protein [Candidatus Paceibacterota bacterium]
MDQNRSRSLRINGVFLVAALVLEYLLGMYVNLFVSFPENAVDGQLWGFAWSQAPLAAHIILAILILLGAIVLLVRSILRKDKRWGIASSIGLAAVLLAGLSGAAFIPTQTDLYSYSMSLMFLLAVLSYSWAIFSASPTA